MGKKLIVWLAGILGLGSILVLAAPYFIPWDKLKDQATTAASKSLGRELKIASIEVGLFSGVHARGISLANAKGPGFSSQPLLSVEDAKLKPSLLSLLSGKVIIESISLIKPQILVETSAEGRSNLDFSSKPAPAPAAADKAGATTGPAIAVASLLIRDGDILLRDRQKKSESALHGLQAKVSGLRLGQAGTLRLELSLDYESGGKKLPLELSAGLEPDLKAKDLTVKDLLLKAPGLRLTAEGKVLNWGAPTLDLFIHAGLGLAELPKLLPSSSGLAKAKLDGRLELKSKVRGPAKDLGRLALDGSLSFEKASYDDGANPVLSGLNGTLGFDQRGAKTAQDLQLDLAGDAVTLGLAADWGSLARVLGPAEKARMDLDLRMEAKGVKGLIQAAVAADDDSQTLKDMQAKLKAGLSLKATVKGLGLSKGLKQPYQSADADFQLKDGVLQKLDLQEKLAAVIPHAETQAVLRKDLQFTQAIGQVSATPARITLKSLTLGSGEDWRGGDIYLQAQGFKEPGKSVDFKFTPHFNPNAVKVGGEVGEALQDEKGWTTYDYLAYYGPDMDHAKADFAPGLKKAAQKAVNKQVEKLKAQAQEQVKQKAQNLIQEKAPDLMKQVPDGLKGLFGQ